MPIFWKCTRCNARRQSSGDFKQEPCPKCGCETADIEIIGESDIKLENMHFVGCRNPAGEPLIRTVCKIAARILLVLLLVGVAVGVML